MPKIDDAPGWNMFLAWIFARELGEIVAGIAALIPELEGVTLPGPIFTGVVKALKSEL